MSSLTSLAAFILMLRTLLFLIIFKVAFLESNYSGILYTKGQYLMHSSHKLNSTSIFSTRTFRIDSPTERSAFPLNDTHWIAPIFRALAKIRVRIGARGSESVQAIPKLKIWWSWNVNYRMVQINLLLTGFCSIARPGTLTRILEKFSTSELAMSSWKLITFFSKAINKCLIEGRAFIASTTNTFQVGEI